MITNPSKLQIWAAEKIPLPVTISDKNLLDLFPLQYNLLKHNKNAEEL